MVIVLPFLFSPLILFDDQIDCTNQSELNEFNDVKFLMVIVFMIEWFWTICKNL